MPKKIKMEDRKKRPRIPKALLKAEKKACEVLVKQPDATDSDINRELLKSGVSKDTVYVWRRRKKSQLFDFTLNQLRDYYSELMVRECAGTAIKNTKKAIKDRDLAKDNPSVFLQWNKLVMDKTVATQEPQVIQPHINIGQVQAFIQQQITGGSLKIDGDK